MTASLILKLGIATVALVGSILLGQGTLSVLTFFMFLLVVARLYDPLQERFAKPGRGHQLYPHQYRPHE